MSDFDSSALSPERTMLRALRLARRGAGQASPNPMVGAVVVTNDQIVGEGYHVFSGRHHAESIALQQAGELARGADLFVTLEPCSHTGRTAPCADEIIQVGVKRVFIATRDPNPAVNGKGIQRMKRAGIEVFEGLCKDKAHRLNEAFFHWVRTGRPFTTLKLALSLDGRIATRTGASKWITGKKARRLVHRLRYQNDGILVGAGTVRKDDPSLDVRSSKKNQIIKVILDSEMGTDPAARLFRSGDPVLIFHSVGTAAPQGSQLAGLAQLIGVDRAQDGLNWEEILNELGRRGLNSLLIEGGGRVAASALAAGVLQRILLFYAPKIIGGDGIPAFAAPGAASLKEACHIHLSKIRRLGEDFLLEARL